MRRSKLELYEDIICALAKNALTMDDLAFECNTSCVLLQERLDYLVNSEIVKIEVSSDKRVFYFSSRRGMAISKTLAITKKLEKLQNTGKKTTETCKQFPH